MLYLSTGWSLSTGQLVSHGVRLPEHDSPEEKHLLNPVLSVCSLCSLCSLKHTEKAQELSVLNMTEFQFSLTSDFGIFRGAHQLSQFLNIAALFPYRNQIAPSWFQVIPL